MIYNFRSLARRYCLLGVFEVSFLQQKKRKSFLFFYVICKTSLHKFSERDPGTMRFPLFALHMHHKTSIATI